MNDFGDLNKPPPIEADPRAKQLLDRVDRGDKEIIAVLRETGGREPVSYAVSAKIHGVLRSRMNKAFAELVELRKSNPEYKAQAAGLKTEGPLRELGKIVAIGWESNRAHGQIAKDVFECEQKLAEFGISDKEAILEAILGPHKPETEHN